MCLIQSTLILDKRLVGKVTLKVRLFGSFYFSCLESSLQVEMGKQTRPICREFHGASFKKTFSLIG
jgi:hypothetical protein